MGQANTIRRAMRPIIVSSHKLHRRGWFAYATSVAMMGFVYLAVQNINAQRRYFDVIHLARNFEQGAPVSPQAIHAYLGEARSMVDAKECRSDLLGDGLTIILADLDGYDSATSGESRTASLEAADRFIVHVLSCTPTDGDAWARLAIVRQALGKDPSKLAALLERSSWYAPAEGTTLSARLEVWRRATEDILVTAAPTLDHDILTVLNYFPLGAAVRVLSGGSQGFQDRVVLASSSLSDERVMKLRKAGLDSLPPRPTENAVN